MATNALSYDDVQEQLKTGLKAIFESGRFQDLLKVMANQKNYSFNNSLMIAFQKPDATMVMGYKEWTKLGRFVEKGEKAIKILAPIVKEELLEKKDPNTLKTILDDNGNPLKVPGKVIKGFTTANVFDVSQTSGKEIPSVRDFISREFQNDEYMAKLYHDFSKYISEKGYQVSEQQTETGVGGYYNRTTDEIVISTNTNKNDTDKFRVLIHEYAHALLHGKDKQFTDAQRGHKEAQAESTAYVVCNYYGLDIGDVSHGYIATWAQNETLAMVSVQQIRETANTIIDELQLLQKEKLNEFYNGKESDNAKVKDILIKQYGFTEESFEHGAAETVLSAINRKNGIVMDLRLETDKKGHSYFRTNRNLIEPLEDILNDGKLAVLYTKKVIGVEQETKKQLNEDYSVKKVRNAGYALHDNKTKAVVSQQFETKDEALLFQKRAAIGQALLNLSEVKREWNQDQNNDYLTANYKVATDNVARTTEDYFRLFGSNDVKVHDNQESIAWALMKNPKIKTIEDFKTFIHENKHLASYKNIDLSKSIQQVNSQEQQLEITR